MKILHILSQIPEATGSGIYLQALLTHAARFGFNNYLLAGIPADFPEEEQFQKLDSHEHCVVRFERDLPFPVVGMSDVMPYPSSRFCDLSEQQLLVYEECFEQKLVEAVERWQPDLIHSHHLWLLSSLTRRAFPDIPLLVSCHGSDLRQFVNCTHLQPQVLAGCQQVEAVCALSAAQKTDIQQLYGINEAKIHLVGAGFDNERFCLPEESPKGPIQILYAGKLSRAKGVPWLLQALNRMAGEEFIFHLVGDSSGSEKEAILQLADRFGGRICVHGKIAQQNLADLMRQADLFVLPSFFEGLPLVLLEALACGCHVVATALPGVVELFEGIDSNWVELVDLPRMAGIDTLLPEDEEVFVSTLQAALQKQLTTLREEPRQQVTRYPKEIPLLLEKYTWEEVFLRIESLYRQLLGK